MESENISVQISHNAGTSFCNTLYWNGLNYIFNKCMDTKMIFLHIPFYQNITEPEKFIRTVLTAVEAIERED